MIKFDKRTFTDPNKSNTIYTLDIETTSLFKDPETGEWGVFDDSKPPEYYQGCEKAGVPYIWMFGVDETVYYGTDFSEIETILIMIGCGDRLKYLWIHNSAFEFQFMRDFLEKYTVENLIARATRKPIAYTIKELNIQVRCTYMLTNLSLARAAERYTDLRKKSGDLDYSLARNPRTVPFMTEEELSYCEYDILTLNGIVSYFLKKYGTFKRIPFTQTGEVRKAFRKTVSYQYIKMIARRTADDLLYCIQQKAFQGGMTHGNVIYIGQLIKGAGSYDIASSYPTTFLLKMPMFRFRKVPNEKAFTANRENWALLIHCRFYKIESKKLNKYILNSKIVSGSGVVPDNGRLVKADVIEMYLTEIDFDIITKDAYSIERIEILQTYASMKAYLPRELITFALQLYNDKTRLKGVKGQEDFYMKQKQMLNSLFGCACTNILKAGVTYDGDWHLPELTKEYIHEKLEGLRHSNTNCFLYQWGAWITANARKRLWDVISKVDDLIIYYDTDSVKFINNDRVHNVIKEENVKITKLLEQTCEDLTIDKTLLRPKDPKGKAHPLGLWEFEGYMKEVVVLGAKRYAFRDQEGKLHTVVSGVNAKTGYLALHDDISNFTDKLVFDYASAGKLISFYNDDQPDIIYKDYLGQVYHSRQRHGICLQPAEYSLSMSAAFEAYIEETQNGFKGGEWIK